jgi:uncharacterized protein (UPF0210 family)
MIRSEQILDTVSMIQDENLDVRTITMGIDLLDCRGEDVNRTCEKIRAKIIRHAGALVATCEDMSQKYGIPVVNKRIAVTPVAHIAAGFDVAGLVRIAHTLDDAAKTVGVDFLGGFSAKVEGGMSAIDKRLIQAIPQALSETERVCGSVNVGTTRDGLNIDALALLGQAIKDLAEASADTGGFAAAKLVVFANQPPNNPFMAGAIHGIGQHEVVINVGVSGPGVVTRALQRKLEGGGAVKLHDLAEEIKQAAFRVTRVGELIGRQVADALNVEFGVVDLSLAPTPRVGDSVGEIIQLLGVDAIGAPGTTAIVAMLNDAVKKGGAFASQSVGGLSGAFIPVCEDKALADAAEAGSLTLEKLEAVTCVCSVGLDMVAVPGSVDAATLAAIMADETVIGVINNKTTATRIIPVPNKEAGDFVSFGGLFGESVIMPVRNIGQSGRFIGYGGKIPAPSHSLRN